MPPPLRASLELDLQDKLTAGLQKLEQLFDRLTRLARGMGLGELEDALDRLRIDKVEGLEGGLRGVENRADAAAAALRRMAAANDNVISVNTAGVATLNRSLGSLAIVPGGSGTQDRNTSPLLLSGPEEDGRIPLNLRPGTGRLGRAARGLRTAGAGVIGATAGFGGAANDAMGGAMTAAMEGFAVYEPIKAYAGFENVLRHIAITEKLKGDAVDTEIKRLTTMFNKDALETGQSSESIAHAYSDLVQMGISSSIIDRAISAHSHAATAYNISAEAMGPAVGALLQNMKIPEGDIGSALAAMAYASKEGRFKVEDFSRQLPGTTGYLSLLGMTGRHSSDIGFAALETIMKNSAEPNQAAANFNDALHYITSPIAKRSFAKGGIDLPKLLENANKQGIDPLDAVLGKLNQKVAGMDPVQAAEYLGTLLHNQQAGMGILSLLQHKGDYLNLVKTLDGVNKRTLDTDFGTAFAAPEVQLRLLTEQMTQLNRTLGEGFLPTIKVAGAVLTGLLTPLTYLNDKFPVMTHRVLATIGGFLLLAAGVGIFKVVAPLFVGAWSVITASLNLFGAVLNGIIAVLGFLLSPIGLVIVAVAAMAAVAYEIFEHWEKIGPFFEQMWQGVKDVFSGFNAFLHGDFSGGLKKAGQGVAEIFGGMWDVIKTLFDGFLGWVEDFGSRLGDKLGHSVTHGIDRALHAIDRSLHAAGINIPSLFGAGQSIPEIVKADTKPAIPPILAPQLPHLADMPQISGKPRTADAPAVPPILMPQLAPRQDKLDITVSAAPGTAVTSLESSNPNATVTAPAAASPNPGRTLNRP